MITRQNTSGGHVPAYVGTTISLDPTHVYLHYGVAQVFKDGRVIPVLYDPSLPAEVDICPELLPKVERALYSEVVRTRWKQRKEEKREAAELGLTWAELKRINALPKAYIYKSVLTKTRPNAFYASLAETIREWAKEKNPHYHYPLSYKQYTAIVRKS